MPTEAPPEQRRLSAAMPATLKHEPFSGEVPNYTQKETEFWKSESTPDRGGGDGVKQMMVSRSKPVANFLPGSQEKLESHQSHLLKERNGILGLQHVMGSEKKSALSVSPWRFTDYDFGFLSNHHQPSLPTNANGGNRADPGVHENSLFSNSLPETFGQKVTLSSRDVPFHQPTHQVHSSVNEEEPFESLEEIEARTIGDLLPDDDDLFSGVDDVGCIPQSNNLDDAEDDIFGMELEVDDVRGSNRGSRHTNMVCTGASAGPNSSYSGEHPLGELPSRTLFVRNINSSVEDDKLKSLFEKYGDIRMLYTACKHRGFVMISYYDIRSASNAMKLLQNKPLRRRKLDIHYSIPKDNPSEKDINQGTITLSNVDSSVSNDDIHQIFCVYGEIKEISEAPQKQYQKIIEFYDSRNAEAAIHALDGSYIAGRQIKLEPSCPQFTVRCGLMQQFPSDLEQEEAGKWQQGSPPNGSAVHPGPTPVQTITSNGVNNLAFQGQYTVSRETVSPVYDASPNRFSSSFPHFISPRTPSMGNLDDQSGVAGIEGSLGKINLSFQRMPNIHSHSLPERQNSLAMGVFPNSSTIMPAMDANICRHPEGIESRHIKRGFSYDHSGAFGAPGNASCPLHGHQYSTDRFHSHHPPPHTGNMMWQNSPPFMSNISARSPSQMHGFPRTSSHMLNVVPFHHHVGSAPTTNAPLWDRHHGYTGDLVEASPFHPASLGNMGFSASPTLHPMELASRNIFPFPEGNCMEAPLAAPHIGIPSPQQSCQMFNGQNPMIHFNGRYDPLNDRMRSRRSDSTTSQGDKKQYELDIERIIRGEDNRTTLMIKNIPNKYTSKMLLATIDEHHRGTYDFIYLPIDFKNKCNVGYAFINLTDPKHIIPFHETFNGKKWEKFNSEKVASLAYARIQGKAALVAHFQNSSLMNEDKRCRPILFHSDGPNAGDQEPFPMGPSMRSRPGRLRSNNSDDEQQGSPPKSSAEGEASNGFNSLLGSEKSGES